jgi:SAM-dependent methyltransferase
MTFINGEHSHQHSLQTLNQLFEYDDFMMSINTLVDLGCGTGEDLEWWATRTTRDDVPEPLNITCVGVDIVGALPVAKKYKNITYQPGDFENAVHSPKGGFDILWCHDAFQYAVRPVNTLSQWWSIASPGAMLALIVPNTQQINKRNLDYYLNSGCYYHHTMVSLIYMLATAGWDCRTGFFKQSPTDPWINAIVYKSEHAPMDPKKTTWQQLSEMKLLPESADPSVYAHGYLQQRDLVVPWIDRTLSIMA